MKRALLVCLATAATISCSSSQYSETKDAEIRRYNSNDGSYVSFAVFRGQTNTYNDAVVLARCNDLELTCNRENATELKSTDYTTYLEYLAEWFSVDDRLVKRADGIEVVEASIAFLEKRLELAQTEDEREAITKNLEIQKQAKSRLTEALKYKAFLEPDQHYLLSHSEAHTKVLLSFFAINPEEGHYVNLSSLTEWFIVGNNKVAKSAYNDCREAGGSLPSPKAISNATLDWVFRIMGDEMTTITSDDKDYKSFWTFEIAGSSYARYIMSFGQYDLESGTKYLGYAYGEDSLAEALLTKGYRTALCYRSYPVDLDELLNPNKSY